jgi:endoglucanase
MTRNLLPRWRGFNFPDFLSLASTGEFRHEDLVLVRDWGFDFVRLPLNYRLWADPQDPYRVDEGWLGRIDTVVELGLALGLHVCLNFHRAPGFTVSREGAEPRNLWRDEGALALFVHHWELFARRYRGVPAGSLSFNLVNEPTAVSPLMSRADHERVIRTAVAAVHAIDPERLIVVDGLRWGRDPLAELADLRVAQSCRGYDPITLSHFLVHPKSPPGSPPPTWPSNGWDRRWLAGRYDPWTALMGHGVGVVCGELGAANLAPHAVVLAWLRDLLGVLREAGIGWALWNFRGPFGVLDSARSDVDYAHSRIGALDKRLLTLLQDS